MCVLTSAPRRLSEHILQKDSRACWKAGDNFLRHTHKKKQSVQSTPLCDSVLHNNSGDFPENLVLPLSHVIVVYFSGMDEPIERWVLATTHDRASGACSTEADDELFMSVHFFFEPSMNWTFSG